MGNFLVMDFLCEMRESDKSNRGATVLHALEYLASNIETFGDSDSDGDDAGHREEKSDRHIIFAHWLLENMPSSFRGVSRVIDVAAGKGDLSQALCNDCAGLHCTLIEPALRGERADAVGDVVELEPSEAQMAWIVEPFDASEFPSKWRQILLNA